MNPLLLTLTTWFSGPGQSYHRLDCRNQSPWGTGIMECWNTENPRLAGKIYFYADNADQILKSGHIPLFIPIIPLFHWLSNGKHEPFGVKLKPGNLGQDFNSCFVR
jgi:hypothetical protein